MRAKSIAAYAMARAARIGPLRPLMRGLYRRRVAIVFYHGVWEPGSENRRRFGGLELDAFRRELEVLRRYFRFVPLEKAIELGMGATPPDEPVMALTFDDGHDMAGSGAMEVLDEYHIPATIFVVTRCIGNQHLMWMHKFFAVLTQRGPERFAAAYNRVVEKTAAGEPITAAWQLPWSARRWPGRLREEMSQAIYDACDMPPVAEYLDRHKPYMSWSDLEAWRGRGHAVGVHTASHPFCSMLNRNEIEEELVAPAWQLRRRLSLPSVPFAYPFGDRITSREIESAVSARAGFSCMLGVDGLSPRRTSPMALQRVDGEAGLDLHLFAKPLWGAIREATARRPAMMPVMPASRPAAYALPR